MAVVLIHTVNPYGFAWSRRVDHDNIDVNRNFVDYGDLPDNPLYDEVDPILNPTDPTFDPDDLGFLADIQAFWDRVGNATMMRTLTGGQYTHPRGVQFGGQHRSWSRQTLERIWTDQLAAASAVSLDIHTGLGPSGRLTVFQTADDTEAAAEMGDAWFPQHLYQVHARPRRDRPRPARAGVRCLGRPAARHRHLRARVRHLDPARGLTAFRADNWLHHHGNPADPTGAAIAQLVRDQFFIEDPTWRGEVAGERGTPPSTPCSTPSPDRVATAPPGRPTSRGERNRAVIGR